MMRWITVVCWLGLHLDLGHAFAPAAVQQQIRGSYHPHACPGASWQRAASPQIHQMRAAPGPSTVDDDYVTPTKSLRHVGVMERTEGVTSAASRKGQRRAETLKSAVSYSSIGLDQLPDLELSSKTLQAIKNLDKEAKLAFVRLGDQLQAFGTYAASRALADTDLVFRVSLVAIAEVSSLLSQRLLPGSAPSSRDGSGTAEDGSASNLVALSLKEKLTLVSLGISPTQSKTDFVMPSFSDAGDTDALVMDMYRKSEKRKSPRFQLPGVPPQVAPVLSGVVGMLSTTASLPLTLVKAADVLRGIERTADSRGQQRKASGLTGRPLGVLQAVGKPVLALQKRGLGLLPSSSPSATAARDLPSPALPAVSSSSSSSSSSPPSSSMVLASSSVSWPPRLAMVAAAPGQAVAALAQPMDDYDFTKRGGALSWGDTTMEAGGGVLSYGGVSARRRYGEAMPMEEDEASFMTWSLPASKEEDEFVIDTKIEVIQDEPSKVEKVVTTAVKVVDMVFVAMEHVAVEVVPDVADRTVLAWQRVRGVLQGAGREREGWELLSALAKDANLAERSVGGFSAEPKPAQWWLRMR